MIIIEDFSGRKLDKFRFNGSDKKAFNKVLKTIKEIYGFTPDPEISYEESINYLENKKR